MKKFLMIFFAIFANAFATNDVPKVFISQVVDHPALNVTTKGIIDGLEQNGFKQKDTVEIRVESAQANAALATQIATKFVNQKPSVVVGVGTLSAQSFSKYAREKKVPLIFSSVTDPLGASLVNSLDQPGNNTSGVSNFVALEPQIALFKQIQPRLKKIGVIYNPGELNSVSIINRLEKLGPKLGIQFIKQTATKTADVAQAAAKLVEKVDAIFISNDNTALSALQSIIRAANKVKIPVYVSDTDAVKLGALAALGPNQYQVGLQTGKMIADVLQGKDVNKIAVEFPSKMDLYLNKQAANILGIKIPEELQKQATRVLE